MATRFYVNAIHAPAEEFAPDAAWDFTNGADVLRMFPFRNGFETHDRIIGELSTTDALDTLIAQFVSPPLTTQTITGTFHGAMMARENNASANMRSQCVVRVIAEDGTVRGTLISATTGALSNEWNASASAFRNARFPVGSSGTSVTSVNAVAGDRIVVEVGYRAHNTSGTTFQGAIRIGNGVTNTDLPSNDTQTTGTTNNPWFEFSQTLTFDVTEYEIFDDSADAVDALPDPLTERLWRETGFGSFTLDPDDPAQFPGDYSATVVSGWIRLDAPADGPAVLNLLAPMGGHESWPQVWVYDEVPVAASNTDYILPYDNENPGQLVIPAGEFRYIALGTDPTWAGTVSDVMLIIRRIDGGAPTGDIKDDIADAVDVFPSSMGTETDSETTNLSWFTTEADDPTETETFTGNNLAYTGWLKLVVPTDALVTLSVIDPTNPQDLVFFLYDEVPTASSVAVFQSDDDSPYESFAWPYLPEITLVAGTYYLMVFPYGMDTWDPFEGTNVTVRVRWEFAPITDDFSIDAVIFRTWLPPNDPNLPFVVGSETATVDSDSDLTIPIPAGTVENDLLVIAISWDREGDTSISTNLGFLSDLILIQDLISKATLSASTDHRLHIYEMRYHEGLTEFTVRTRTSLGVPMATAKAGAITTLRNASRIDQETSVSGSTSTFTGPHLNQSLSFLSSAPNYGMDSFWIAIWAGGAANAGRWDFDSGGPTPTELYDATATSFANIVAYAWTEQLDHIDQKSVIPRNVSDNSLRSEINLTALLSVQGLHQQFGLQARLNPGFPLEAFIQAATHTTHPRTGPHTGTHLDTAVVTSAMLGSLPAGTDLHTVLVDLDAMLTDLENQE